MVLPLLSDLDFIVCGVGNQRWGCLLLICRLFDQGYSQVAMFRKKDVCRQRLTENCYGNIGQIEKGLNYERTEAGQTFLK